MSQDDDKSIGPVDGAFVGQKSPTELDVIREKFPQAVRIPHERLRECELFLETEDVHPGQSAKAVPVRLISREEHGNTIARKLENGDIEFFRGQKLTINSPREFGVVMVWARNRQQMPIGVGPVPALVFAPSVLRNGVLMDTADPRTIFVDVINNGKESAKLVIKIEGKGILRQGVK